MRKLGLVVVLFFALALAACGGDSSTTGGGSPAPTDTTVPTTAPTTAATSAPAGPSAATIAMGGLAFSGNTDVSIKAGQSVKFDDSTGGGSHNLVTGTRGTFTAAAGAPTEFSANGGLAFNPGDVKIVKFATAGTYHITCTFHPSMQATVVVAP
jgi:plastocyanin